MAKYNIPNLYIANRDRASAGGGSDPTLEARVEALETSVDGDGGLSDQVETLDEQINGDSTATPPVPGIVDEIEALEVSLYGDSTTTPATLGIVDQLTASNDVPFRFGYDSTTQKYGYILDIGGADTVIPFNTGGAQLSDINANKDSSDTFAIRYGIGPGNPVTTIPIQGYETVSLKFESTSYATATFIDATGTDIGSSLSFTAETWTDFTIPSGAVMLKIVGSHTSNSFNRVYYALLA